MSAEHEGLDPNKKHRHDIGAVDHGALRTIATTTSIQYVMGSGIVLTIIYTVYSALVGWLEIAAP